MSSEPSVSWRAAFARFADALNAPLDPARLAVAVTEGVRLERHAPGERVGDSTSLAPIAETFHGAAEVARWLARSPVIARFAVVGDAWLVADGLTPRGAIWSIEYAITAGEFHNGGHWHARLADDGRIAFLSHRPFAIAAAP